MAQLCYTVKFNLYYLSKQRLCVRVCTSVQNVMSLCRFSWSKTRPTKGKLLLIIELSVTLFARILFLCVRLCSMTLWILGCVYHEFYVCLLINHGVGVHTFYVCIRSPTRSDIHNIYDLINRGIRNENEINVCKQTKKTILYLLHWNICKNGAGLPYYDYIVHFCWKSRRLHWWSI